MRGLWLVVLHELQKLGHKASSLNLLLMCCAVELHNHVVNGVE